VSNPSQEYEDFRRPSRSTVFTTSKGSKENTPPHSYRAQPNKAAVASEPGTTGQRGNPRDSLILIISSGKRKASGFQKNLLPLAQGILRWPFRYSTLRLLTAMATGVQKEAVEGACFEDKSTSSRGQ
jgi:hypothetical protein